MSISCVMFLRWRNVCARREARAVFARRHAEAALECAAKGIGAREPDRCRDRLDSAGAECKSAPRFRHANVFDVRGRRATERLGEAPAELTRAEAGARGERLDREIALGMRVDPGHEVGESIGRAHLKLQRLGILLLPAGALEID